MSSVFVIFLLNFKISFLKGSSMQKYEIDDIAMLTAKQSKTSKCKLIEL